MSLKTAFMLTASIFTAASSISMAQAPGLSVVMNEKAENAQRLVRPLVTGDFAAIDLFTERLGRLTYTEVASWQARPEPLYLKQADRFVEAVQNLREASRARDLDRTTTEYANLLSSCVGCHRQVRALRTISLTPPAPLVMPAVPGCGS